MLCAHDLEEALDFYGLADGGYRKTMEECRRTLIGDAALTEAYETIRRAVFSPVAGENQGVWKFHSLEELIGREMPPFTGNLVLLSGWEIHLRNMDRLHFDQAQREIQKMRVRQQLTMSWKDRTSIGYISLIWAAKFVNGTIVEVGRMQYEWFNFDGTDTVNKLHMHIPSEGGSLTKAAVTASLTMAHAYLPLIFGADADVYAIHSWLLSPQLRPLLKEGSNMAWFADQFEITQDSDCTDELRNYLYHWPASDDVADWPEDTSLQRAVKPLLMAGQRFYAAEGVLKKQTDGASAG